MPRIGLSANQPRQPCCGQNRLPENLTSLFSTIIRLPVRMVPEFSGRIRASGRILGSIVHKSLPEARSLQDLLAAGRITGYSGITAPAGTGQAPGRRRAGAGQALRREVASRPEAPARRRPPGRSSLMSRFLGEAPSPSSLKSRYCRLDVSGDGTSEEAQQR